MAESEFLTLCLAEFRKLKTSLDAAVAQISQEDFHRRIDANSNTIAELMKHLAGNTLSRCRNFLTSDGEKPDRDRDGEFITTSVDTQEQLRKTLDEAWAVLLDEYGRLTAEDLDRTVYIRNEPHSVRQALLRQLTHHAGHVGQIVFLAKSFAGHRWRTLSIPRGQSKEFEKMMRSKHEAAH
jgi:uncharacterized damage-inducible protein DinB